ncbi:FAD-dependent monooxygenase, partial [Streptomyces sp. NPDC007095]|uniref:FAD-dependent monooxygenase n=1 Tax=Streptomyces sp. NPDC007095 TaxID=3154482 RepID=UPI00340BC769
MDPVIIVGAGPVGLTLALALARQEVPSVVLDEGPGKDEQRLARTVVLREDTAALVERLTGLPLTDAGFRWAGWRSMRRKQVMREIDFAAGASGTDSPDFEADAQGLGGAAHGSGAHGSGGGAHGEVSGARAF